MKNKIILGTVQLGLPYGINNSLGKPSEEEAFRILDYAFKNDIRTLDSADGYGDALSVIGQYQTKLNRSFSIINKFKVDASTVFEKLQKTLALLANSSLYCYMYHHYPDYESGIVRQELNDLKRTGVIQKIGVSLYGVDQLASVVDDQDISIIQLPVNLLDLSSEKVALLQRAKLKGKEVHARSVYLQGLFFKDPDTLTGNLIPMRPYLDKVRSMAKSHNIDIKKAALNHILRKEYIDYVVLGIDHVSQLVENLTLIDSAFDTSMFERLEVSSKDIYLLNPANWRL